MSGKFQKKISGMPWIRILIICVLAAVFMFALIKVCAYLSENAKSKQEMKALADLAVTERETGAAAEGSVPQQEPAPGQTGGADGQDKPVGGKVPDANLDDETLSASIPIQVDFDVLQEECGDIVAWIYCEDTVINYPIVQGEDNQYYVRRLTDGTYNTGGTLFMDFRNTEDLSDRNSIIYGHNMTNDTMFGTLVEYKNQAYFEAHPCLWILTPEKAYRVDLLAGLVTASDDLDTYCIYEDDAALQEALQRAIDQSTFDPGAIDVTSVGQIVTLSTCTFEHPTARYVVIGSMTAAAYPEN